MYTKKKIEQIIRDTKLLEQQIQASTDLYILSKKKIQNYFDEADIKELEVKADNLNVNGILIAKKVERVTIVYNVDALKVNLDKEVFSEIIDKEYTVKNMDKLKKLLKQANINPKDFKDCIDVKEYVNKEKIKHSYAVGDINQQSLKGTYKATLTKYIQIKEGTGGSN